MRSLRAIVSLTPLMNMKCVVAASAGTASLSSHRRLKYASGFRRITDNRSVTLSIYICLLLSLSKVLVYYIIKCKYIILILTSENYTCFSLYMPFLFSVFVLLLASIIFHLLSFISLNFVPYYTSKTYLKTYFTQVNWKSMK